MDDVKPFWKSKTLWANALALGISWLNGQFGWLGVTGEESAALLVLLNFGLRAVTKGAVSLS